jgi:anti-sigma factor RsiW
MKQDVELKLQAYLDGELDAAESASVAALLREDAEARALYTELEQLSTALKGNELERRLPESREFYWSRIERELERLERQPHASIPWWIALIRRNMAAMSGLGVATLLLVVGAFQLNWVSRDVLEEIDNPLAEDSTSFSFRSESQKMTVVWISNPSAPAPDMEPETEVDDDFDLQ